jgi:hypothetical protein
MSTPADEWSDRDFIPPPDRTFDQLVASLHERLSGGVLDGAMIEDLRLYIVARMLQGLTQPEVENELIGWGLPSDYVIDLVCSTRSAGNYGPVEVQRESFVNGVSAGVNRSPTYGGRVRGMERAESRIRQAQRMLGIDGELNPNLAFDTTGLPQATHVREPRWARIYYKLITAILLVGAVVVLYIVLACAGLT